MSLLIAPSPEILAPAFDYPNWNTLHWFAVTTRSRHEKLVARELENKKIATFLPLKRIIRHWSDRKKTIEEPLFKGYVFIHTSLKDRWTVLNTYGVSRFVGRSAADPCEVPERDLLAVRRFLEEKIEIDPFPYLKEGERVYVRAGTFKGVEGFIVRKDDRCRLIVSVDLLMQSISVEIDQACVEPV